MEKHVIIAAGGIGTRMKQDLPKQFIPINGKPVIVHTLEKFISSQVDISSYIISCHPEFVNMLEKIIAEYLPHFQYKTAMGGDSRYASIKNALNSLKSNTGITGVHDAARPCVSSLLINEAYKEAEIFGSAIPYVSLKDTIRRRANEQWVPANRQEYIAVQTPQVFNTEVLKNAYTLPYDPMFTDDATVVEKAGHPLHFIPGSDGNIKITTTIDLAVANTLLLSS